MKKRGFALLLCILFAAAFAACGRTQGGGIAPGTEGDSGDGNLGMEDGDNTDKGTEGDDRDGEDHIPEEDGEKQGEIGDMLTLTALNNEHAPIVDGSGMSGADGRIHLHSADAGMMYKGTGDTFVFDIGHTEKLGELHIWNYNASGDTGCGAKEVEISVSEDNENYSAPVKYTLAQASGKDGQSATNTLDGDPVDFNGGSARYIRIRVLNNYGGDGIGLSALRLFRYRQQPVVGESISCDLLFNRK